MLSRVLSRCLVEYSRILPALPIEKEGEGVREAEGDIWDHAGRAIIAVTTGGLVARNGRAAMPRGCARQAAEHFPELPQILGELIASRGNHVHSLPHGIVSFPVEETPFEIADPKLILRSTKELVALADREGWREVVVPRPGCGGGGLSWSEVRPLLADILDDRFLVIHAPTTAQGNR